MKKFVLFAALLAVLVASNGCSMEKHRKDRSEATDMFERICRLTEEYTRKLEEAPDSADWAAVCSEFEEKLDKINFSYSPDTDLLLTEGQNDTIHTLMQEFVKVRKERLHGILHPIDEIDTLNAVDSIAYEETDVSNAG